jgi:hypothetical protein
MKRFLIPLALVCVVGCGCSSILKHSDGRPVTAADSAEHPVDQAISGVATALNPVTGGISGGLGVAALAAIGLYRKNAEKQRMLDEIDAGSDTAMSDLIRDKKLKRKAEKMTAGI